MNPCLCTVNHAARGKLPKMYVNVSAPDHGATGLAQARVKSVVDTGSTCTLISLECLSSLELSPRKHSAPALVALDGKALSVRGFAKLRLDCSDGCVHLPVIDVEAVVVDSLDVVDGSVLIGGDVISGAGGVHLEYQDTMLSAIWFGPEKPACVSAAVCPDAHPSPHVKVS